MTVARITTDPDVMGGVPGIRGLRMPVTTVADGMTRGGIISDLTDLTAEDITEALRYAVEA